MAMQIPFGLDNYKDAHGSQVAEVANLDGRNLFYIYPTVAWDYPSPPMSAMWEGEIHDMTYHFVGSYLIADKVYIVPRCEGMVPFWINVSYIEVRTIDDRRFLSC
jgi:hypothetical protein